MTAAQEWTDEHEMSGNKAMGAAASAVKASADQMADMAGQAKQIAQEQADHLAEAIKRRPLQAAGIAAGVGVILALLARR